MSNQRLFPSFFDRYFNHLLTLWLLIFYEFMEGRINRYFRPKRSDKTDVMWVEVLKWRQSWTLCWRSTCLYSRGIIIWCHFECVGALPSAQIHTRMACLTYFNIYVLEQCCYGCSIKSLLAHLCNHFARLYTRIRLGELKGMPLFSFK